MSISSAIKSASSRWLSWRSECRCGAWHPEIISPCGASPVAPEVGGFKRHLRPMLCPASKSGVSGDTDASSSFASSAASCVMLLSGSRWRRRSRPGSHQRKRAISQLLSLPVAKRATAAASERAHDQMRSIAVPGGPQRDAYCRLRHSASLSSSL